MRIFVAVGLLLSVIPLAPLIAQTEMPSCFHISSDQDGDGFGYENSMSCVVDETTRSINEPGICRDDNADGFGWNGVGTCVVEATTNPDCEDTAPVGDGWGWDGANSCRVVPLAPVKISELEIIKSKLITREGRREKSAGFYCPATDTTVFLNISFGGVEYYIGQDLIAEGMWSTGLYDKDGFVWVRVNRYARAFGTGDGGPELIYAGSRCRWLTD